MRRLAVLGRFAAVVVPLAAAGVATWLLASRMHARVIIEDCGGYYGRVRQPCVDELNTFSGWFPDIMLGLVITLGIIIAATVGILLLWAVGTVIADAVRTALRWILHGSSNN